MEAEYTLPPVPAKHSEFLRYFQANNSTPVVDLVKPYNQYDAVLRKIYAQQPSHPAAAENLANIVPLFDDNGSANVQIRARDPSSESEEVQSKYLMSLKHEDRRANGSPAVVTTFKEFQKNFNIFCEGSLADLDWSNVVAAGSAVITSLLPVPKEYAHSKRGLRQFYHEKFTPASDVDLFLYGLTEEQAIEKIKQIETKIKDSILTETTTVRTKNAITIASQYPTRHVQIVLRIYKSIAEILTGFDVDCSCAAYDGHQVYLAPRAVGAFVTQVNQIDLTRRSPSYENRLSKYSHRGFEIFWPHLDRSRIDPTVFERSFTRTKGLARLLVLEKLPRPVDRDQYLSQRRAERGRPPANMHARRSSKLNGNIKNDWDDEVPDWLEEDEVSDYHTFTIPYGVKFHARKIEKLLYTKDLLLNAEWNKPKDRTVNLHRHPAFFGHFEDVIHDCCGYCPTTATQEEKDVAEEEDKIYVKGDLFFLKDNPGRQEIGSFNPITDTDWTEMAYVGNTESFCQAIIDQDIDRVREWLSHEESDPNRRDYTGRAPLHLAVMSSTPEIVQCLVDHGARLISRLADGRTALHLAAGRGDVEIIRILLTKSAENEEEEAKKESRINGIRVHETKNENSDHSNEDIDRDGDEDSDVSDAEIASNASDDSHADDTSYATGSFVNVKKNAENAKTDGMPDDANDLEPDIYDINVLAWDSRASPLHLAIINGHIAAVEELVSSFGADVLLPIKLLHDYDHTPRAAILTLVLALRLPIDQAKLMTEKLLQLGASPAQGDLKQKTALHYVSAFEEYSEIWDIFVKHDRPAVQRALDCVSVTGYAYSPTIDSALTVAIKEKNVIGALKLLNSEAIPEIRFEDYIKSAQSIRENLRHQSSENNETHFLSNVNQPVISAVYREEPVIVLELLNRGVDPNTLSKDGHSVLKSRYSIGNATSLLDCVRDKLDTLRGYKAEPIQRNLPHPLELDDSSYLNGLKEGTYQMWSARKALAKQREIYKRDKDLYDQDPKNPKNRKGLEEKKAAVAALITEFENIEAVLIRKGAKKFVELYPEQPLQTKNPHNPYQSPIPGPFKTSFSFNIPDLTPVKRYRYIKLFEAAWDGNLDSIKEMTIGMWGPEKQWPPLEIGITDTNDLSPFTIAILRGHFRITEPILAIAQAQYKPQKDEREKKYDLRTSDDECSDYDSENEQTDDDASNDIRIKHHIIDDQFTIDNVGEIKTEVETSISPLDIFRKQCATGSFLKSQILGTEDPRGLIEYAICKDDLELLKFLLDLGKDLSSKSSDDLDSLMSCVSESAFQMAMRLGRLNCLKELIRCTGTGLPLDKLVEKSGTGIKEKPKFYQGLSVHGEKRADWAAAGGGIRVMQPKDRHPPLLLAAHEGNLETVEWFLGTAPSRYYAEFAKRYKHDKRLKGLAQAKGGIELSIETWLSARRDLTLHCAVMSKERPESIRLVEYLVNYFPQYLLVKSLDGYTPLALAFSQGKVEFAKILINAGADQTTRDKSGRNLLHLLFQNLVIASQKDLDNFQNMLDLVDPLLLSSMLIERCSVVPGSLTPLALWMGIHWSPQDTHTLRVRRFQNQEPKFVISTLRKILEFAERTGQKHLEVLNGAGNTVVHDAVRCGLTESLQILLDHRPDLLHRENSTGCTPCELAEVAWISEATSNPPERFDSESRYAWGFHQEQSNSDIVSREPETFVENNGEHKKQHSQIEAVYRICCSRAQNDGNSKIRKLVTLFDANEVAKRLATRKVLDNTGDREARKVVQQEMDEVRAWLRLRNSQ
ncbi:ankyrin repeat protein [Talaromyces proteolyticus]|uniref:Ankyrin repeat protein n=1 Tax=Talaromyces proteolyticus TaxID=1131652 RepID=A0AAD4PS24_9EURO|nr:ankyrin repeat protein [Talaromyces proteolyticus]KAH8690265.1 ankyrin repeat protein [Talaromyces proteolyticus]